MQSPKGVALSLREFVRANQDRYLEWLCEACSIPSLPEDPQGLERMAEWCEAKLRELGATTERLAYGRAPQALLGELGSGERTLLVYDHYDVQPVDPLELWASDPFSPELRDGVLYARGCADNKGDLVARLAGLHALGETRGSIPVGVKFLIEGEEETGSRNFDALVSRHGERLVADGCVWEGAGLDHAGRPEFVFGAKGLLYVELTYRGLNTDQHSSTAVIAPSPVWHLVEALSTLRDKGGRVLIDGFYDDALARSKDDDAMLSELEWDEEAERERLGIREFVGGATGKALLERLFFEGTCNIAGIVAGFTVPGTSKTVLPKEAMAKLDFRLVPNQDPDDIVVKLRRHLETHGYGDITIAPYSKAHPVRSPSESLVARATIAAAHDVYVRAPALSPLMIGTGPMYPIAHTLGIPTVSPAGVCRPDSNIHAPNENIRVEDFVTAIEYSAAWLQTAADL
jgi:acetylornithine deacetylase/succinyl-diaminopimelate desuccinylase-like protein